MSMVTTPRRRGILVLAGLALLWAGPGVSDEPKDKLPPQPAAAKKPFPETLEDLRALEKHVQAVVRKVTPATVGVQVGFATGSGVIVSADGHVLTAGHVSGQPGRDAFIFLPDGKKLKAKTLGRNGFIDSGMMKISEQGKYPFIEMGNSKDLKKGQWVLAIGQPGGFRVNRTPVVRLGRVIAAASFAIQTDATLVGGDSGGPLFDLDGKVVGIHSRIGGQIVENIHVPIETYRQTWDRLAKGESWGGQLGQAAVVQSLGGKIVLDVKGKLTEKDPPDKTRDNRQHQVVKFRMTPGHAYTIDLVTLDKKIDPFLRLEDASGNKIADDDDGGGFVNARIVFKPAKDAEYRISVSTFEGPLTGPFQLTIRQADLKDLFVSGKVEVWPAVKVPRQVAVKAIADIRKFGVTLHLAVTLFDKDDKPAPNKDILVTWKDGKKTFKTDDQGAIRFPLLRNIVQDLFVDLPAGLRAFVQLTDPRGNPAGPDRQEKIPSAGGDVIFTKNGKLTTDDPKDKVKTECHHQVHEVQLQAGAIYTLELTSPDFDAFLRLEEKDAKPLAADDDSGGHFAARIVFRPEKTGVFRLAVTTADPGQAGAYLLTVREKKGDKK